jgi:hypothetical protein
MGALEKGHTNAKEEHCISLVMACQFPPFELHRVALHAALTFILSISNSI